MMMWEEEEERQHPKPYTKQKSASSARLRNLRAAFSVEALLVLVQKELLSPRTDGNQIQLSATDVLAPTSMKNAAKCDT